MNHPSQPPDERAKALVMYNRTIREPSALSAIMVQAAAMGNLVAPATAVEQLPEGFAVALSTVVVDVKLETYSVVGDDDSGGQRGLSRPALDRIAMAAGISWDLRASRRLDDGRDPHYCQYFSAGNLRHFDGRLVNVQGTKEMDLRDGSAQVTALVERYREKLNRWEASGRRGREPKDPGAQIREMRLHIMAHAETKSRLRAIRSLGIRSSYTAAELAKPFVVARLMLTGQSDDPELRRQFAVMQVQAALEGGRALYGEQAGAPYALPPPRPAPPIESPNEAPEAICESCGAVGTIEGDRCTACAELPRAAYPRDPGTSYPPPSDAAPPAASPSPSPPKSGAAGAGRPSEERRPGVPRGSTQPLSGLTIPGRGEEGGLPIEQASDNTIDFWMRRIERGLREGTTEARYVAKNERLLDGLRAEIARREAADPMPW